ncbi:hypothetical protein AC1031_005626 [Aphanomyces cochlioides]|nr:hypothetical protein AC1031_005626 [Aphanomyces cochlioides]
MVVDIAVEYALSHPFLILLALFFAAFVSSGAVRRALFVGTTYVTLSLWYQYRQLTKPKRPPSSSSSSTTTPPTSLRKSSEDTSERSVTTDDGSSSEAAFKPSSIKRTKPRNWAD